MTNYRVPGTESDPALSPELFEMVTSEIDRAAAESGADRGDVAIAYLVNLLSQRDHLSDEVDAGMVDQKTGLLADRVFREAGDRMLAGLGLGRRGQDRNDSALLYTFDIEGFGEINRTYGHAGGDERLKAVGKFLSDIARMESGDLAGRIGGDEFALLVFYDSAKIGHADLAREFEERITNPVWEKYEVLPNLRWNHAIFHGYETLDGLMARADVKGPYAEGTVRYHSHGEPERQVAFSRAMRKVIAAAQG